MNLSDFDYHLPEQLIAQQPAQSRDGSRLLVYNRGTGRIEDRLFPDVCDFLNPGDLLVFNDTKVIPARLLGQKSTGGRVELLLVRCISEDGRRWQAMSRSSKPIRPGTLLQFGQGLEAEVLTAASEMLCDVKLLCEENAFDVLERIGHIPLPPYIQRSDDLRDRERYQTVFARHPGSVAAPTAGLHFTREILDRLAERDVECADLTLHVGPGTFLPVRSEDISRHRMHREAFEISSALAEKVNRAKEEGRRVIAVGTTTTRALESAVDTSGKLSSGRSETEIFIRPGYTFRVVDALITNFHLPRSTLLMLVSAFAGREKMLDVYRHAVARNYRFFSYGDCMLIV